jgi:hypothetical protein
VIEPYRSIWDATQISHLEEQLAGACTTEIAAFDARWISRRVASSRARHSS